MYDHSSFIHISNYLYHAKSDKVIFILHSQVCLEIASSLSTRSIVGFNREINDSGSASVNEHTQSTFECMTTLLLFIFQMIYIMPNLNK